MTRRQRISRLRRGTNQHTRKHKPFQSTYWNFAILPVVALAGLLIQEHAIPALDEATTVRSVHSSKTFSPLPEPIEEVETKKADPAPDYLRQSTDPQRGGLQSEIEAYIREVFSEVGDIAVAVSRKECSPYNPTYPHCVLHTDAEYSVGAFQINLYNSEGWVHAGKVPGDTMQEKIEWAQDWRNNIDLAKQIYDDWGGFTPWSAFTNGAYKAEL